MTDEKTHQVIIRHIPLELRKVMRLRAIEENTTIQNLALRALKEFFLKDNEKK